MVERSRAHERLTPREVAGARLTVAGVLSRPVEVFIPATVRGDAAVPLIVHFLGGSMVPIEAVSRLGRPAVLAVVSLTAGTSAYEQPFLDRTRWPRLLAAVDSAVGAQVGRRVERSAIYFTAFSAGHGSVRAILADSTFARTIDGVMLLDGLHTGYIPPRKVVAEGGQLDPANLQSILRYARRAVAGEVRLIITHSEIFPGTFASTTETANWVIDNLGIERTPVLEWGPLGMQQTSVARAGGFTVMGFSGNSAPDHIDHLHALVTWMPLLVR
jgi:hypothetical protein